MTNIVVFKVIIVCHIYKILECCLKDLYETGSSRIYKLTVQYPLLINKFKVIKSKFKEQNEILIINSLNINRTIIFTRKIVYKNRLNSNNIQFR